MRGSFSTIKIRKPKASRSRSNEVYLLGLNYSRRLGMDAGIQGIGI